MVPWGSVAHCYGTSHTMRAFALVYPLVSVSTALQNTYNLILARESRFARREMLLLAEEEVAHASGG